MASTGRVDTGHRSARVSSEILDRLPPHSAEAEQGVLGSLILNPNLCDDVCLIVGTDDFYADAHRRLYAQMIAMHDDGGQIDITLLVDRLKQSGELEAIGGKAYLAEVVG